MCGKKITNGMQSDKFHEFKEANIFHKNFIIRIYK